MDRKRQAKVTLLKILKDVQVTVNTAGLLGCGICELLNGHEEWRKAGPCLRIHMREIRKELFTRWPDFSGNKTYPVPSGAPPYEQKSRSKAYQAELTFNRAMEKGFMWSDCNYGRARRNLLKYMITTLEEEVKNGEESVRP